MSKLELNMKVVSKFKGEINGITVSNEDVYYTLLDLLEYLTPENIPLTKWSDFISDLIKAFEDLKSSAITDSSSYVNDYTYVESLLTKSVINITNIEELTDAINDIVETEGYTEFEDIYNKLKDGYYTS